jgi:hypothetical protein
MVAVKQYFITDCFYRELGQRPKETFTKVPEARGRCIPVNKAEKIESVSKVFNDTSRITKVALWWLKHYETIMPFWRGFSCHLKNLEDGPEKEEAHELMIRIIKKRVMRSA